MKCPVHCVEIFPDILSHPDALRSAIRQPSYPVYPPPQAGYRTEIQNATNPLFSNGVRYDREPPIRADGGVHYDPRRPYSPPPSPRGHTVRLEPPSSNPVIVVPPVRSHSPPRLIPSPSSPSGRTRSEFYYRVGQSRSRSRSRSPRRWSPPRRLSPSPTRRRPPSPTRLPVIPGLIPISQPQSRSPSITRRLSTIDSVPIPLVLDDTDTGPVRPHSRPPSSPRHREARSRSTTRSTKSSTRVICRSPSPVRACPESLERLSTKSSPKHTHRGSRSRSPRG